MCKQLARCICRFHTEVLNLKTLRKKIQKVPKSKTGICCAESTQKKQHVGAVLSVQRNQKMVLTCKERVGELLADTMSFCKRNKRNLASEDDFRTWSWNHSPGYAKGQLLKGTCCLHGG